MHVLEWFIEHHTLPPDVARQTIEEQRRRILFELDAPLTPSQPHRSSTRPAGATTETERLHRRMTALRRQMSTESTPEARLRIRDELTLLGQRARELAE